MCFCDMDGYTVRLEWTLIIMKAFGGLRMALGSPWPRAEHFLVGWYFTFSSRADS